MAFLTLSCDRNMNDVISTGQNTSKHPATSRHATWDFARIEMTSFMFLSQHRDTHAMFYLLNRIFLATDNCSMEILV